VACQVVGADVRFGLHYFSSEILSFEPADENFAQKVGCDIKRGAGIKRTGKPGRHF
jgi:hypothetical protein